MYKKISLRDTEIEELIELENQRQEDYVELIASENYVSEDVLKAAGSCLTNKYGEGYPGKRLLHKKEQKNYLMSNMLMFNHIQEVLQMLQSF